jgi:YDG domain-containing protein/MBG domain-containing protein/Big-like domain-containing protein
MLGFFWGESAGQGIGRGRRGRGGAGRRGHRPHLEALEARLTPSTGSATWTGASGIDSNWMTAGNWSGGTAPLAGYDLIFPAGATSLSPVNNFPAGTSFNSITIGGSGYALTGNAVDVAADIDTTYNSGTSSDAIATDLVGGIMSVAAGGTLDFLTSGVISGSQGLGLSGGGTLDLGGLNTYTGTTTVSTGTRLFVDGTTGPVQNNAGLLGGNGTVGAVASVGGIISPGHSPGVLTTGSLTLDSNSTFVAELDGTSPGNGVTGYDQVVASGAVDLGGAALDATLGGTYVPTLGDQLTIIQNGSGLAVTGTFAGLPEGGAVSLGTSVFRITYQGGPSNDNVVLTDVSFTSTTTITGPSAPVTYGQLASFTATVTGSQGTPPTGTVAFYDGNPTSGGTELGTPVTLNALGSATETTSSLGVTGSPHQVYAVYIPDTTNDNYAGSTSTTPASVTITPVTLTVSGITAENKVYDATTNATIDTSSAVLSGVLNGDMVTLSSTTPTATFSSPNVGTSIPVTVTGLSLSGTASSNYVLAPPTGLTADITPAPLTLTANDLTMNQGGSVPTLTFTATGFEGSDTTAVLTTQPTLSTSATSSSPAGTYPININGGSAANYTITDVPGTLTVVISTGTTTTLTSSSQFAATGQPVTFTATVSPVSPSAGTPTGTVFFILNNTSEIGEETLDPATRQASFTTSSLPYGSNSIVAFYQPDPNSTFQSSESSAVAEFTTSAGTQPSLTVEAVRNRHGKIVAAELVAQILVTAPGSGTPAGTAIFFVNGRAFYQGAPVINGTATLTLLRPRVVNKFVFVRYLGYYTSFEPSVSTSQLVSRRSLLAANSVTESASRVTAVAESNTEIHHPVEVAKAHLNRGHRRHT